MKMVLAEMQLLRADVRQQNARMARVEKEVKGIPVVVKKEVKRVIATAKRETGDIINSGQESCSSYEQKSDNKMREWLGWRRRQ